MTRGLPLPAFLFGFLLGIKIYGAAIPWLVVFLPPVLWVAFLAVGVARLIREERLDPALGLKRQAERLARKKP